MIEILVREAVGLLRSEPALDSASVAPTGMYLVPSCTEKHLSAQVKCSPVPATRIGRVLHLAVTNFPCRSRVFGQDMVAGAP